MTRDLSNFKGEPNDKLRLFGGGLLKVDRTGGTQWVRYYFQYPYVNILKHKPLPHGEYVLFGDFGPSPTQATDAGWLKVDSLGNILFTWTYSSPENDKAWDIETNENGDIFTLWASGSRSFLKKRDSLGVESSLELPDWWSDQPPVTDALSMKAVDGGLVILGLRGKDSYYGDRFGWIYKLDGSGNSTISWGWNIGIVWEFQHKSIIPLAAGRFLTCPNVCYIFTDTDIYPE